MARKLSIKGAVRQATRDEAKVLKKPSGSGAVLSTVDSFANFAHKLGVGADNPLSTASYGFNPVSRNRQQLEWIYRGSWLGAVAVDVIAEDMTREGIDYVTELAPEAAERIDRLVNSMGVWPAIADVIKWGRLYGGGLGVVLIDGQDVSQPFDPSTVGPGAFKGILVLDRWMVDPTLEDLVTEMGPRLGTPCYYRVSQNAPALRGRSVHHSRVVFRHLGITLPYNQALTENLWGISIFERLWDRMIAFDSATTGAAQLVYKSFLRTLKVKDLRSVIAAGGDALKGLVAYVDQMRRFQGIEGMTVIDGEDEFEIQGHQAFSGLADALDKFAQQIAGALQIPLTRLLGQAPGGMSTDDQSGTRTYYDHIMQLQMKELHHGVTLLYRCAAASEMLLLPDNFTLRFKTLWKMSETDKAATAKTNSETVIAAKDAGLISDQVAMQELRQSSRQTGVFTNITEALIEAADDQVQAPLDEQQMQAMQEGGMFDADKQQPDLHHHVHEAGSEEDDEGDGPPGPNGPSKKVDDRPPGRKQLQLPSPGGSKAGGADRQRVRFGR
jgi:phage-related protein (TIGR01555 family)